MRIKTIVALSVLLVAGYFGYCYYQYRTDPMIAGIPPYRSVPGFIDYTMIARHFSNKPIKEGEFLEWVVRLPEDTVQRAIGTQDFSISGGGISTSSKGRPNKGYELFLQLDDLKPAISATYGARRPRSILPESPNSFIIQLKPDIDADLDEPDGGSRSHILTACAALGTFEGGMEMFGPDPVSNRNCDNTIYSINWADSSKKHLLSFIACLIGEFDSCRYSLFHKGREFDGFIAREDRFESPILSQRLGVFLDQITVIDHIYSGTPFVYQVKK